MMKKQRAAMVTKEFLFLWTPPKNRVTVGVRSKPRRRLATTALLGLASVRSARASAANHRESISDIEVTDYARPQHFCGPQGRACGEQKLSPANRVRSVRPLD
jgi:hypothetical protein